MEDYIYWASRVGVHIYPKSDPTSGLKSVQIFLKIDPNLHQNRSKILTVPWGTPPPGPSWGHFRKMGKNCSQRLIPGSLLGAKLAALGAQDGATDGQVGGTWGPKWRQQGQNNRSQNRSFFGCLLKSIFFRFWWILGAKMKVSWHQNRMENQC